MAAPADDFVPLLQPDALFSRQRSSGEAAEGYVNLPDASRSLSLFVRVWGLPPAMGGIPLLFVHGGPGNAIAEYREVNEELFDKDTFFVLEVDQRGTGNSNPSVRRSVEAMQQYLDISLEQMGQDFEVVREFLGIDRWFVFGGSWGSTLGLYYSATYPERCLGTVLRGIYLNTHAECEAIYNRKSFEDMVGANADAKSPEGEEKEEKKEKPFLHHFDIFFNVVKAEDPDLSPHDARRIMQVYEKLILQGDRNAIWNWHVYENNVTVDFGSPDLLDPFNIDESEYLVAQSVAFFEARLFLKGTYETPEDLLGLAKNLGANGVPSWVVQGLGDDICPQRFAESLEDVLEETGSLAHPKKKFFADAGHFAGSLKADLSAALAEFVQMHRGSAFMGGQSEL